MNTIVIQDWLGNTLFDGTAFEAYDDADDFLYNYLDNLNLKTDEAFMEELELYKIVDLE